MTLTELRYIVAVAHERHFGRAAAVCYISQPTLSVAVRKLEEELGVKLFERGRTEITPTPIGERIIVQAQRTLEEAAAVKQIAGESGDPLAGPLRLGVIYTIGPYLLPHLIPLMRERAPQMQLLVEEDYTANLSAGLKQGELDVIVIALPFEMRGIDTQPLYDEPFVILLPLSHPLSQRKTVRMADLERTTMLLLGPGHCFRDQVLEACPGCLQSGTSDDGLQRTLQGGSLETIRHMVAGGIGVTVLPCSAAGADQYSQRLVTIRRFAGASPSRRVALAWRKSFPRLQAVEVLRQAITECPMSCVEMVDSH